MVVNVPFISIVRSKSKLTHAGSPAEFAKLIADDIERYTKVVRDARITVD